MKASSQVVILQSASLPRPSAKNRQRLLWPVALAFLIVSGLFSVSADARPIRIDQSGTTWTLPTSDSTVASSAALGFTFNLFGVSGSSVMIDPLGNVSFGGAVIQPFDGVNAMAYSWQSLITPIVDGGAITNGFRVCWECETREDGSTSSFQLGLFELATGEFVIEFNFNTLLSGDSAAAPFIGFDNGAGSVLDLLGLRPDLTIFGTGVPACDAGSTVLACNFDFDSALAGFSQGVQDYFQTFDTGDGPELAVGRYVFVIGAPTPEPPTPVPAPGPALLILFGLLSLGLSRRVART